MSWRQPEVVPQKVFPDVGQELALPLGRAPAGGRGLGPLGLEPPQGRAYGLGRGLER
jgi:hypothetical protein